MTDNTIRVRADITDDPDAIHTDDGGQDDQNVVIPPPPAAGAAGQTTLAFKVEQSKIPEYFGQKGKERDKKARARVRNREERNVVSERYFKKKLKRKT